MSDSRIHNEIEAIVFTLLIAVGAAISAAIGMGNIGVGVGVGLFLLLSYLLSRRDKTEVQDANTIEGERKLRR